MGYIGQAPANKVVKTADIEDSAITSAKILDGTIANADVNASAAIASSKLDTTDLRSDIMTLALKEAITENRVAYNLPNAMIEQFQDDSKLGTETTGDRNASEYWDTTVAEEVSYSGGTAWASTDAGGGYVAATAFANDENQFATGDGEGNDSNAWQISMDFGSGNEKTIIGYEVECRLGFGADSPQSWTFRGADNNALTTNSITLDTASTYTGENPYSASFSNSTAKRYWGISVTLSGAGRWQYITELNLNINTINATGTLISTAQTANSAQTKVSGVILYKNQSGTATLGTDLKIYFTCDGGSNWTESTPTAAGTFSSGILMAKCPEVTCTSGTDIRYKAVWANQSSGSKETQLHGVGMNY